MAIDNLLQPTHLILVLVIALIVLGPKRLPEVGRSLGRSIQEFKRSLSDHSEPEHAEGVEAERPRQDSNLGPAE
jgi:sec-independent protein translocase protein TatA